MGKLQLFEIRLSESRVVYSPGEPLAGTVTVRLSGSLPYRAIKVSCVGSCGVSNKANDTAWTVEEQYFNSTLSLADKGVLTAGEHSFPFQFLLPASAPTSFEGPFGKVVHQVKAVIDTPRFAKDHKCNKVFYILCPLNLNDIPDIEQPNTTSVTKKFNYKLVKSGNIILTATSDLKGYIVGQAIQLRTDIENKSGRDTGTVVASLLQKVAYKSKRWIYDLRTIAEVEGSGVKAWKHAEWKEQILVPALPQSVLHGCSLIHVDYYIQKPLLPMNKAAAAPTPASAMATRPVLGILTVLAPRHHGPSSAAKSGTTQSIFHLGPPATPGLRFLCPSFLKKSSGEKQCGAWCVCVCVCVCVCMAGRGKGIVQPPHTCSPDAAGQRRCLPSGHLAQWSVFLYCNPTLYLLLYY
ncbi:arrestin domain-containing protein 1 isoform X2 [Gopherus flavomarginatus]|uniref:arrestin domain-containing protein 1 isoform X2 n=1 Tax=Gopherus flavomarginatus TaxID=286002 RepID=UPI0021CBB085|nr:arrestin domain-containing protein 1 isoform X2 [Gopherus flavomarginatus]